MMRRTSFTTAARLGLGAALLLLGARAVPAAITLGPPIEVPAALLGPPDVGSLAVLEDGGFAIGRRTGERRFEVLFFTPDGTRLGEPETIYASNQGNSVFGAVGPFGDRYFVIWSVRGSGKTHAAFFSREGERLGRALPLLTSDSIYDYQFSRYARGPRGRVLPFFAFQAGRDRWGYPVYASRSQVFGPEARFLGRPVQLLTERHYLLVEDAALNEQGRFVVAFLRCPRNPRSRQPCIRGLQRFEGAWVPRSPLRSEGLPPVSSSIGPGFLSLALAGTGDHLVVWVEQFGAFPNHEDRVLARIFRPEGLPAGAVLRLNGPRVYESGGLRVRATHARTFITAWAESPTGFGIEIYLREVDGRTGALGEQILVAKDFNPTGYGFEMNSTGRGVVW
ncbi:MAG: hypothetical protein ACREN5_08410, partial [Gemmatimonadales bacterium]